MDGGERPKKLRSFLVQDILGLDNNCNSGEEMQGNHCFSQTMNRQSDVRTRKPKESEQLGIQFGHSSSDEIEEKSSIVDYVDWQGW